MPVWFRSGGATAIAALIVFAAGFGWAWIQQGWRMDKMASDHKAVLKAMESENLQAVVKAYFETEEANQRRTEAARKHIQQQKEAKHANALLMDAIAHDTMRLHIKAAAPADCSGNESPASGSLGDGIQVEVAKDTRQDYYALIDSIAYDESVIAYLQEYADLCEAGRVPPR